MKSFQRILSRSAGFCQSAWRWPVLGSLAVLIGTASMRAETVTIVSDTTWRAIGPLGNLEGNPIESVGSAWEAAHSGWNTKVGFEDSDKDGWHAAISSPLAGTPVGATNSIWVDGNGYNGSSPAYFRKTFLICGPLKSATMNVHVDDDAQVYLNGVRVLDDHDGHAGDFYEIDLTQHVKQGQNLLAIKAHDSYGIGEQLAVDITIETGP